MNSFDDAIDDGLRLLGSLRGLSGPLHAASDRCLEALRGGGKLLLCGNGGSASQAQHLTGELVGRYKNDRAPLAALTLSADPTVLTCIGNDYHFDEIFSRPLKALGRPGDVLIVFSTSGRSPNVLEAMKSARGIGMTSVAFLGRDGGEALPLADYALVVEHQDTARIQEGHEFLLHCFMDLIELGINQD